MRDSTSSWPKMKMMRKKMRMRRLVTRVRVIMIGLLKRSTTPFPLRMESYKIKLKCVAPFEDEDWSAELKTLFKKEGKEEDNNI